MTQSEKERCIKIVVDYLYLNLPEEEQTFWVDDFTNYLDITL